MQMYTKHLRILWTFFILLCGFIWGDSDGGGGGGGVGDGEEMQDAGVCLIHAILHG